MATELRRGYHDRLAVLHDTVGGMIATVAGSIPIVTDALLEGDQAAAEVVVQSDDAVDRAYPDVEREVFDLVATQGPVARDLRFLIATLRIAQDVERSGDLTASIARRVDRVPRDVLSPQLRTLLYGLGAESGQMFDMARRAYAVLDDGIASGVRVADDAVDELHRSLLATLFAADLPVEPAVELGLVARFYERLGDHAVVIAERVCFVASGEMDSRDRDERAGS